MKKSLFILALGLMVSFQAAAQSSKFTISYPVAFATGDLADYIKPVSFRGLSFDYTKMINRNVGLGLSTGWNVFYEELAYDTYTVGNESISGKQYRYSNSVPLLFTGSYYVKPNEKINPFARLGIGTIYTRRNTDMGIYTYEQEAWNFALAPEVGILVEVMDELNTAISIQYYNGFQAGNELDKSQSYFALKIGVEL